MARCLLIFSWIRSVSLSSGSIFTGFFCLADSVASLNGLHVWICWPGSRWDQDLGSWQHVWCTNQIFCIFSASSAIGTPVPKLPSSIPYFTQMHTRMRQFMLNDTKIEILPALPTELRFVPQILCEFPEKVYFLPSAEQPPSWIEWKHWASLWSEGGTCPPPTSYPKYWVGGRVPP